jgi:hypothetical protein
MMPPANKKVRSKSRRKPLTLLNAVEPSLSHASGERDKEMPLFLQLTEKNPLMRGVGVKNSIPIEFPSPRDPLSPGAVRGRRVRDEGIFSSPLTAIRCLQARCVGERVRG